MPDHVHLLLEISLKLSVSYLKGKSALMMFDRHANLKYKFGNRHFWSEGFYVSLCRYRHNDTYTDKIIMPIKLK